MPAGPRATMDFFAAQAAAKRRTAVLVLYFALAWLGTILLVYLGLELFLRVEDFPEDAIGFATGPGLLGATAAFVTLVVSGGAAFHAARLARGGGHAVARMVGGVEVDRATTNPAERRLVNVVEEMAIASGLPVPGIYVLPEESGVNAFAAGFTPERSVVAVTRGALEALTRDELQGVVAHEFSHVLNADSRLNLRLVALVGGITVLALVGRTLVRSTRHVRVRSSRKGGGSLLPLLGLLFWVSGSVGAFFGRLIRAAVSRQREFLADAAAVQFTRNPDGLAGALAKVAARGSAIAAAQAPEVSHLFFASGLASSWLSTHPPLEERIRRIAPHGISRPRPGAASVPEAGIPAPAAPAAAAGLSPLVPAIAVAVANSAGHPGPRHVAFAHDLLAGLPEEVLGAAREPRGARALVLALVAAPEATAREVELHQIADAPARAAVERLAAALEGAPRERRMEILDLALPTLDGLRREEAEALLRDLGAVAGADGRTSVLEWAVLRIVRARLAPVLGAAAAPKLHARTVEDVQVEALEVLSALAWLGAGDPGGAQAAVDAGAAALGVAGWRPLPRESVRAARLDAALARLAGAAPGLKERLLSACTAAVLADRRVTAAEGEVVRAVASSLGVPVPPLVPG